MAALKSDNHFHRLAHGLVDEVTHLKPSAPLYGIATLLYFMLLSRYLITIPVIIQMIAYTIPIVVAGSFFALSQRIRHLQTKGTPDECSDNNVEVISKQDALLFPIIASFALALIYGAFKYLSAFWVNTVLAVHICIAGCYAIGATGSEMWRVLYPNTGGVEAVFSYVFPRYVRWLTGEKLQVELSVSNVLGLALGCFVSLGWIISKAWFFHNLFAICLSVHAIRLISVGTFKTATILLCGLFVYDVFWVFETDVMVTVAKSFDAPAKILFPTASSRMGLLGLGDVVVPGIFIAMTLRFDYQRHLDSQESAAPGSFTFKKFYFSSSMIAYGSSLCLTGVVMLLWQAAQPALLYLVPSLLVSVYAPALIRGELGALLAYSEEKEEEEDAMELDDAQNPLSDRPLSDEDTCPAEECLRKRR